EIKSSKVTAYQRNKRAAKCKKTCEGVFHFNWTFMGFQVKWLSVSVLLLCIVLDLSVLTLGDHKLDQERFGDDCRFGRGPRCRGWGGRRGRGGFGGGGGRGGGFGGGGGSGAKH
ncbi:hypothetical protein KIW84_075443, partial [Lathyrus oleraceus]